MAINERVDQPPPSRSVLGMRVDRLDYADASDRILGLARARASSYVCVATVHMVMEAHDDPDFRTIVDRARLVTSDGMPLVWALRMLGLRDAQQVRGTDLTFTLCKRAAEAGIRVGFYGSSQPTLVRLCGRLQSLFPALEIAYAHSPPFRPLTQEEQDRASREIADSGTELLFVGLGCPKQERWMAAHTSRIPAVMVGVGAAFDFLAGTKAQPPDWMRRSGMEWVFRLTQEPGRLWRRYLRHNPRFVLAFARQLLHERR
jgi:N-acetylglucosaminyldiphosphoundecaprenol N-acetyl-beta-D-mannosaminyltransferase